MTRIFSRQAHLPRRERRVLLPRAVPIRTGRAKAAAVIVAALLVCSAAFPARLHAQVNCKVVMGQTPRISCCNGCCERWQSESGICRSWWYRIFLCLGNPTCVWACLEQARWQWQRGVVDCEIGYPPCDCTQV